MKKDKKNWYFKTFRFSTIEPYAQPFPIGGNHCFIEKPVKMEQSRRLAPKHSSQINNYLKQVYTPQMGRQGRGCENTCLDKIQRTIRTIRTIRLKNGISYRLSALLNYQTKSSVPGLFNKHLHNEFITTTHSSFVIIS